MATDFIAGCIGGFNGVLVGHPFDTIKVRLQAQSAANPLYKGTIDCFISIIKKETIFGLYKGITSPLYGLSLINCVVFGVQANVQRQFSNPNGLHAIFISGSVAGLAQTVVCSPMELAKTRMQIQGQGESRKKNTEIKGPVQCLLKIYKKEGIRGVFLGFGSTAMRETPSFGVYFVSYELLTQPFITDSQSKNILVYCIGGGFAGICSWVSTYPVDVIKTRLQADKTNQYNGFIDCCKKSYKQEGIRVFGKGLCSTLVRAFPVNAATFCSVEMVLKYLKPHDDDDQYYKISTLEASKEQNKTIVQVVNQT